MGDPRAIPSHAVCLPLTVPKDVQLRLDLDAV